MKTANQPLLSLKGESPSVSARSPLSTASTSTSARVIFMEAGSFVAQGTPEDFFANQMKHDRIRSFLTRIL